jgi:hypothetical protein
VRVSGGASRRTARTRAVTANVVLVYVVDGGADSSRCSRPLWTIRVRYLRAVLAGAGSALALLACGSGSAPVRGVRPLGLGHAKPSGMLYLASTRSGAGIVTVVDVGGARTEMHRLSELSPGDPPYSIAMIDARLVVYGRVGTYAFGWRLREPARLLGESWFFIPSATPGRVWLVLLDRRDPNQAHGLGGVREVTLKGKVTVARSARPPATPVAAVDAGLLVQGHTLEVWQPVSGRVLAHLPGVFPLATRHSLVVSCAADCLVLHVTDTRTGADIQIHPGRAFHFIESYDGAFSPDGRLVAVPATGRRDQSRVAIVDIARRTASLVRGASLASDYTLTAWSSTGWLFYNAGHGRLAAYQPGSPRAALLDIHVHPFESMAAR